MANHEESLLYQREGSGDSEGCLLSTPNPMEPTPDSKYEVILLLELWSLRDSLCPILGILISVLHFSFFNYFINPGCGPNSLVRLAVSVSANFEIILVKSALSRFANWKIRAFCRRKDFLAQCVSSFSCSRVFQFVAEPLQHYREKTVCLKLWTAVTPVFHYVSTVFL